MSPCLVITSKIRSQPKIPFRTILELQILTGSQPLKKAASVIASHCHTHSFRSVHNKSLV